MIERSVDALIEAGLKPVVVTRRGADYSFLQCPILYDKMPEKGPLGGLWTAMSVFRGADFLTLTCDMPNITASALKDLLSEKRGEELLHYSDGLRPQPFPGIYPGALFRSIGERLIQEKLSIHDLLESSACRREFLFPGPASIFLNVNEKTSLSAS